MKTSKIKKLCAVVLAATLGISVLAGCGSSSESGATGNGGATGAQELTFNLGSDLKTLDPALNQAVDGGIVLENLFEGLYKPGDDFKPVPGIAESYDLSDDQTVYTFHLRKDAKWTNGDPVTAGDFEYAWKRVLDPATAAEYSYQMMYLVGAAEYNESGTEEDKEKVGVKAIDDNTLEVKLTSPCAYFLDLVSFPCYFPVNKKVAEENKDWSAKAETYVSNGPFKLSEYKIKDGAVLEKNDTYYNKDQVTLDKLNIKFVAEPTSAWANYKAGQFDMIYQVPAAEVPAGKENGDITIYPQLGTYYYSLNVSDRAKEVNPDAAKALSDVKVRKALNLAIDREAIVNNVTKGGQIPATSFVPTGIPDAEGKDFKNKDYYPAKGDVEQAKKLLEEAGYPNGQGFPTLTMLINPEGDHSLIAQAVQDMWKTNLGINIEIQSQEWKVFQQTRVDKNYQVARDGWVGDYNDPMTFIDLLESTSGLNNSGYNNPKYDELVEAAKVESDAVKRMDLLHQAEDVLMEDMPLAPVYYYTQPMGVQSYVKGLRVSNLGFIYFDKVTLEK
ncbi:MAG: peptide ABC transporter substrate-binding protein [Clostridium butyricum]|nr:peptide ABC transporter substrate-binding protein [Clostridium butyricum]